MSTKYKYLPIKKDSDDVDLQNAEIYTESTDRARERQRVNAKLWKGFKHNPFVAIGIVAMFTTFFRAATKLDSKDFNRACGHIAISALFTFSAVTVDEFYQSYIKSQPESDNSKLEGEMNVDKSFQKKMQEESAKGFR